MSSTHPAQLPAGATKAIKEFVVNEAVNGLPLVSVYWRGVPPYVAAQAGRGTIAHQGNPPLRQWREAELLRLMNLLDLGTGMFYAALGLQQLYKISYWDAQIIAAAESAGCTVLYSEDLNPGQTYAHVNVVNPFSP